MPPTPRGPFQGGVALTQVADDALKQLLRAVHHSDIALPLSLPELTRHGLQHCASPLMAALRGLDAAGVRAVLVAVLAERAAAREAAGA